MNLATSLSDRVMRCLADQQLGYLNWRQHFLRSGPGLVDEDYIQAYAEVVQWLLSRVGEPQRAFSELPGVMVALLEASFVRIHVLEADGSKERSAFAGRPPGRLAANLRQGHDFARDTGRACLATSEENDGLLCVPVCQEGSARVRLVVECVRSDCDFLRQDAALVRQIGGVLLSVLAPRPAAAPRTRLCPTRRATRGVRVHKPEPSQVRGPLVQESLFDPPLVVPRASSDE